MKNLILLNQIHHYTSASESCRYFMKSRAFSNPMMWVFIESSPEDVSKRTHNIEFDIQLIFCTLKSKLELWIGEQFFFMPLDCDILSR